MKLEHWQWETSGGVSTLTLNRPEQSNNINLECLDELRIISEAIMEDSTIRVVILRSAGKHFSVGMDVSVIGQMAGSDFDAYAEHLGRGQKCIDTFESIRQPIITEIRGFCIGAGVILSACADFRISSDRAVFALPEVKRSIGVIMGLDRVTRLVGITAAKRMAMLGENYSAREMLENGFLTEVVPDAELTAATNRLIRKLCLLPPAAVQLNKRIINFEREESLCRAQQFELREQFHLNQTADFREAMQSFTDKRTPRYTGK